MKKVIALILLITFVLSSVNVFAASEEQVARILIKVSEESTMLTDLYKAGEKYRISNNVTNQYIDNQLNIYINRCLTELIKLNSDGTLNESNFESTVQNVLFSQAQRLEPVFLLVVQEAYSNLIVDLLSNKIPAQFEPLYKALVAETKDILGWNIKFEMPVLTPFEEVVTNSSFTDMGRYKWANEAVESLLSKGIINGIGNNLFDPSADVKREEFTKMLSVAFNIVSDTAVCNFNDVNKNEWYYKYIASMAEMRMVNGISETEFGVGDSIIRQDMAVMIYRIGNKAGIFGGVEKTEDFADSFSISDYATEAVSCLKSAGILNGSDEGYFFPHKTSNRAEAAQILYNFYNYILNTQNN
ncbi:MAG: S-layer homology domain-containing protein [Clostridia bacterium]|nr:S-layer homology domain-containing protein [Clostridia bacterium]